MPAGTCAYACIHMRAHTLTYAHTHSHMLTCVHTHPHIPLCHARHISVSWWMVSLCYKVFILFFVSCFCVRISQKLLLSLHIMIFCLLFVRVVVVCGLAVSFIQSKVTPFLWVFGVYCLSVFVCFGLLIARFFFICLFVLSVCLFLWFGPLDWSLLFMLSSNQIVKRSGKGLQELAIAMYMMCIIQQAVSSWHVITSCL